MRLAVHDIDDFPVTPGDLSDIEFEGSPERVKVIRDRVCRDKVSYLPVQEASFDRPSGSTSKGTHYDLSEIEPPCDLTISWSQGTAFLHLVAYHYCQLDEILDYGDEQRKSPRGRGCTEEQAFKARAVAENEIDLICKRTFRSTYRSMYSRATKFQTPWPVAFPLSPGFHVHGESVITRDHDCRHPSMRFAYVTGDDAGVPLDLRRACTVLAAQKLMPSLIPDRATGQSTEAGTIRFTLASASSTGLPDVDAVLARYMRSGAVVL